MEATRRLEVEVPEELAGWANRQIEAGRFANESEAVASALTLMREQDDAHDPDVDAQLAAGYDAWKADPTGGIPLDEVNTRLDEERKRRAAA